MAKIGYLLLCEDVVGNQDDMAIRRPYVALTPLSIPSNYSFSVAFSLFDLVDDTKYEIKLIMATPTGNIVMNEHFTFHYDVPPEMSGKVPYGQMNIAFPNFPLTESGIYKITLSINDENSKSIEIPVHKSNK